MRPKAHDFCYSVVRARSTTRIKEIAVRETSPWLRWSLKSAIYGVLVARGNHSADAAKSIFPYRHRLYLPAWIRLERALEESSTKPPSISDPFWKIKPRMMSELAFGRMGRVISTGSGATKTRTPHMADFSNHRSHEGATRMAISFILPVDLAPGGISL